MRIAVDGLGGDHAPEQVVQGAARADVDAEILLVGPLEELQRHMPPRPRSRVTLVAAARGVEMDEPPARVLRHGADTSMSVAVDLVARREADAVVSAGNSGALVALARTRLERIRGIDRPAIATPIPTPTGQCILLDAGANVDCQPIHLAQFGILGAMYCKHALGIDNPRVGLLNIGTEITKGNGVTRAAHELMQKSPVNFVGFVEGNHIFTGEVDVVVCDGFVGNALLKAGEGLSHLILSELRRSIYASRLARIGLLLMYPALRGLRRRFDYSTYGGALLLGVRGICVVCHGRSNADAIANAIAVAYRAAKGRFVEAVAEACEQLAAVP
ncbi:MAG: phosphate acyltransferase PlsX [Armatimonadetes bacterium]|nr:phosphate acyltransferase PlsX [Armatimonadota bacterium]